MNGNERVRAAIGRQPLDRVPMGELVVERQFMRAYLLDAARSGGSGSEGVPESHPGLELAFFQRAGLDLVCLQSPDPSEAHPDPIARAAAVLPFRDTGLFVFALVNGAFQTLMLTQGFERLLKNIARRPEETGAALQRVTHTLLSRIRVEVGAGVDGIIIGDDLAYGMGPYASPGFIEQYLQPCWCQQVACARDLEVPVFFHSDGNINALLPAIVASGFDGLQCLESAAGMDMARIKARYGTKLCLMGNIDAGLLSPDQDPDPGQQEAHPALQALEQAVTGLMSAAAPGGGYIFGTSCGLYPGLAPHKVRHMYALARELGAF